MLTLANFLDKFKNIGIKEAEFKKCVILCIKSDFNKEILPKDVSVRLGVLYIKANPALKNELFMKKSSFLQKINSQCVHNSPVKDVR
jgi:hypothetical protein